VTKAPADTPADTPADARELAGVLTDAVDGAFTAFTAQRQQQRDDLFALTMSGLGGCSRQAAYRLARVAPSDGGQYGPMPEANIGTMIHEGLLPRLATLLDGKDEQPVTLRAGGLVINGRCDLYSEPMQLLMDLKTVGTYKFGSLTEVVDAHRMQVAGYAWAMRQTGRLVRWVAWLYLDRSSGAPRVLVEPFTDELVALVRERCEELAIYAQAPEKAPRDERGPGLSFVCDGCPWLRRCWGEDAEPGQIGAQAVLARDDVGVEQALTLYDDARVRAAEAKAEMEFARAMLHQARPGTYGGYQLSWSTPRSTADTAAAVTMLTSAGIPVPTKSTSRRMTVRRRPGSAE
jgi:PD-(D/E)XK nuclease superfamily protein